MTMGIGKLGENTLIYRKYRWTFEGKDKNGNIVFPATFVKVPKRPNETEVKFQIYGADKLPETNITSGSLKIYDGCGCLLEEWQFEDAKFEATDIIDYSITEFDVEFTLYYKTMKHIEHVPIRKVECTEYIPDNKQYLIKQIEELRKDLNGEYCRLSDETSCLDGWFSSQQLRKIADLMDKLKYSEYKDEILKEA